MTMYIVEYAQTRSAGTISVQAEDTSICLYAILLFLIMNRDSENLIFFLLQSGVVQGIMHLLLLSMSAHLTKQLGMAPGGEFRRAFREVTYFTNNKCQSRQGKFGSLNLLKKYRSNLFVLRTLL